MERKNGSLIEMLRNVEKLTNGVKRIKLDDVFQAQPLVKPLVKPDEQFHF